MSDSTSPVPRTGLVELVLWGLRRRRRYRVKGGSMVPTLAAGDFVLADPKGPISTGTVVVAEHPDGKGLVVVKRVAEVTADGLDLRGDAPADSTDSRTWGPISPSRVLGTVTSRTG